MADRDAVLFEFHCACKCPTTAQIEEWCAKYPEFAEDIRDHAEIALEDVDAGLCREQEPLDFSCDCNACKGCRCRVPFEGDLCGMCGEACFQGGLR